MAGDEPIDRDFLLEVVRRAPMLAALRNEPMTRRDLEESLGISKSTSHRNANSLAERGLLRKSDGRHTPTEFGQAVADVVATFEADMRTTVRLAPVFEAVAGTDPPCPIEVFADATVTTADRGDPFGPLARFLSLVRETDSLRMADSYAIAPTYIDEIHGRVLDGLETTVISAGVGRRGRCRDTERSVIEAAKRTLEPLEGFEKPDYPDATMAREQYGDDVETYREAAVEAPKASIGTLERRTTNHRVRTKLTGERLAPRNRVRRRR